MEIICEPTLYARYVAIYHALNYAEYLTLCEVQITVGKMLHTWHKDIIIPIHRLETLKLKMNIIYQIESRAKRKQVTELN